MDVTRKTTLGIRLQRYSFTVLFLAAIGLLAWLSTQYVRQADWTAGSRNSLSEDSARLLDRLSGPVVITSYARENPALRNQVRDLIARYQRRKDDVELHFVNPDAEPERMRELGVMMDGELRVVYEGRSERVQELTEHAVSNALLRAARQGERWISFLSGHGERNPGGQANHDLGNFGSELERKGLKVRTLNLTQNPQIPENSGLLVIAGPQTPLLAGEVDIVLDYLERGGNLLWLADPGERGELERVAEFLGVGFLPGVIVDTTTQLLGIQNPDFALVPEYPAHPVTRELQSLTLFPRAAALEWERREGWQGQPLLSTLSRAWTETGPLAGEIAYDADGDERPGPLDLAFAFSRATETTDDGQSESREQRVIVAGDGDFLSNAFLANGANLDLGLNMIDWLNHDDDFIAIRAKAAPDQSLTLSGTAQAALGLGFLFGLPLALLAAGVVIWLRRRKR